MMALRWYQRRCIEGIEEHLRAGARSVLCVAPTGAGKTVIMSHLAVARVGTAPIPVPTIAERRAAILRPPNVRVLVFVHREELIRQTVDKFAQNGLREVGVIAGSQPNRHPTSPVQVASIQTLVARQARAAARGEPMYLPGAQTLFLDEAHHFAADEWKPLVDAYPNATILGFTATPERGDGRPLGVGEDGVGFEQMVVAAQPRELIADGWLVPFAIANVAPQDKGTIGWHPVEANRRYAAGKRTIMFCQSVPKATEYANALSARGVTAATISTYTKKNDRKEILERFEAGQIEVLCNVDILTEGFDCPGVECVQIARHIRLPSMYLQMAGRGARICEGKGAALLIDQCGCSDVSAFGPPEADRTYSLEGRGITLNEGASADVWACRHCQAANPMMTPRICIACGKPPPAPERRADLEITNASFRFRGVRRDPDSIRRFFALLVRAAQEGQERRWAAESYHREMGSWPWGEWARWFDAIQRGEWSGVPDPGREAAAAIGLREVS